MKQTSILTLLAAALLVVAGGCGENAVMPVTGTIYGELVWPGGAPAADVLVVVEGMPLSTVSDSDGKFVIGGVEAVDEAGIGKYYDIRGEGTRNDSPAGFLVDHFKVKGQQSYSIGTVTVPATGSVTGRLTLEGETDHSGIRVTLRGLSLETTTRADGSFILDRVPEHDGYAVECRRDGWTETVFETMIEGGEEVGISVDPGEITDLGEDELSLAP